MRNIILFWCFLCVSFSTLSYAQSTLFMPLKYDSRVTKQMFQLDGDTTSLSDRVLMKTYLKHPEAVTILKDNKNAEKMREDENLTPIINGPATIPAMVNVPEPDDKVEMVITKPNFWTFSGDYSLQFMQNYISPNWHTSGNSNYSMLGAVTLQYNYNNKQRIKWDNKLELKLGLLSTEADTINKFKTTEDLIRYTTQLSLQAYKQWYYAAQLIASTQFAKGRKNNDPVIYSDFMSPFTLNVSLGMNYVVDIWNKKLTGNILLAPLSYYYTYVDRLALATRFGVDEGKHSLHDIGSLINIGLVWKPADNIKWETRFYTFSNYSYVQLEWENTINFQFNRYISTKLSFYPRFDDHEERTTDTYWQLKEFLSIGFAYSM